MATKVSRVTPHALTSHSSLHDAMYTLAMEEGFWKRGVMNLSSALNALVSNHHFIAMAAASSPVDYGATWERRRRCAMQSRGAVLG